MSRTFTRTSEARNLLILSVQGCVDGVWDDRNETEGRVKDAWQYSHFAAHSMPFFFPR